jgi:hypothetical protein
MDNTIIIILLMVFGVMLISSASSSIGGGYYYYNQQGTSSTIPPVKTTTTPLPTTTPTAITTSPEPALTRESVPTQESTPSSSPSSSSSPFTSVSSGPLETCQFIDGKCKTAWYCYLDDKPVGILGFGHVPKHGITIDQGHTSGDAAWACNAWKSDCQGRCTAKFSSQATQLLAIGAKPPGFQ